MNTPFMTIKNASAYTGLSQYYIRTGCQNNSIPHIMSGTKYLVEVEGLLKVAKQNARKNMTWEDI